MPEVLTAEQIYALAVGAGFSPSIEVAPGVSLPVCMTAIALRESNGEPSAYNGKPPDDSFGLWQANFRDPEMSAFFAAHGVTSGIQLQNDPALSARVAFLQYGGRKANLGIAWAVYRTPSLQPYQQMFESHLPVALAAEVAWKAAQLAA